MIVKVRCDNKLYDLILENRRNSGWLLMDLCGNMLFSLGNSFRFNSTKKHKTRKKAVGKNLFNNFNVFFIETLFLLKQYNFGIGIRPSNFELMWAWIHCVTMHNCLFCFVFCATFHRINRIIANRIIDCKFGIKL